jgi:aspartyl-tRNA(Asn)/glutamyl-tRNA(Gln) amidotransferase subunit C
MIDEEKIRKEGIALLEEFSRELEGVPDTEETHYVLDLKNVLRSDDEGVKKEDFPDKFRKIVPRFEDGYVVAEKGV